MVQEFEPKLVSIFREGYSRGAFARDLGAGVLVGIVALPLSIAFAIASGVKPEQGLYTAVVAGFLISALSGSRVQIGGPTGAFIVLVYDVVLRFGYEGLAVATVMAGIILLLMGLARLGAVIKFIPYPVTVGFTSGIAVIILAAQLNDLLGLGVENAPADFVGRILAYLRHSGGIDPASIGVGAGALGIIVLWPRVTRRVPGSLIAILACTAVVALFHLPVETIGSRFGSVPGTLPKPQLPAVDWATLRQLFPSAFSLALLAAIESLLSAVVADGMTGRRHRSNMELVAQGVANLVSPLFQGIPATGAIARTATNIKSGGRTPVAGMVHALTLLAIMLFFGRWAVLIPLPVLAAILVMVAYNMSEWRLFLRLFRGPRGDVIVLLVTFGLTVIVDLTVALEVGMVLAAFLFMRRMALTTQAGYITRSLMEADEDEDPHLLEDRDVPEGVEVFEIMGPFFFGAADHFKDALRLVEGVPRVLILRMRHVPVIDATGLRALEVVVTKARNDGSEVILSGVQPAVREVLQRGGLLAPLGEDRVVPDIDAALLLAREIVEGAERRAAPGLSDRPPRNAPPG